MARILYTLRKTFLNALFHRTSHNAPTLAYRVTDYAQRPNEAQSAVAEQTVEVGENP